MGPYSQLKLPFPRPDRFAVIQMDPVEMVQQLNLDDEEAILEAYSLNTKKYLVYLELDLPGPKSPWCRFTVLPVATPLRPDEPSHGIASDMVMPIAPNTRYAKGRTPITANTPFPFDNCFFWIESRMTVRVKIRPEGYDESNAVALSSRKWFALTKAWMVDLERIDAFRDKYETALPPTEASVVSRDTSSHSSLNALLTAPSSGTPSGISVNSGTAAGQHP
ncbi:hypothetical protein L226DRAFT_492877, partial [Lentinus tigrinus ALCF2SS1-7]